MKHNLQLVFGGLTRDPTRRQVHTKQQYVVKTKSGNPLCVFEGTHEAYDFITERAARGVTKLQLWSQTTIESELEYKIEEISQ